MTARSIRRAAERKQKKMARKAERVAATETTAGQNSWSTPDSPLEHASEPALTSHSHANIALIPVPASDELLGLKDAKPVTPAQLAANRANAQVSTGPRTPKGKARSSSNAVKSGLTSSTVLLPSEDAADYAAFISGYQHDFAPVGQAECELVQAIADADWRLRRVRALEFALYTQGHLQFEEAFDAYSKEVRYSMIQLQTHMTYEKQFRNYHLYETRIGRRREKDMAELRKLQGDRKSNQRADEDDFADLHALFAPPKRPAAQLAVQPPSLAENGFEFSSSSETIYSEDSFDPDNVFLQPEAA